MPHEIATRTARHHIGNDGIPRAVLLPGAEQTLDDARENIRALESLLEEGQRYPVLIDYRPMKSMERGARTFYAGPEATRAMSAVALIVDSPLSRIIGTFFMGLNKSSVPTRLFTSETEALAWLRQFIKWR